MNSQIKLFLTFLLFGLLIGGVSFFFMFSFYKEWINNDVIIEASIKAKEIEKEFHDNIEMEKLKLTFIRDAAISKDIFRRSSKGELERFFYDLADRSPRMMQLRFLDTKGIEKIRVDRELYGQKPRIVNALQDKSGRYYFKEAMRLKKGEYWISKLDLNIEHHKVEIPIKPVLRIATPLYIDGVKKGILIVNIFMKKLLLHLMEDGFFKAYIVDSKGNVFASSVDGLCFNDFIPISQRIKECSFPYKQLIKDFQHKNSYRDPSVATVKLRLNNSQEIYAVVSPNLDYLQEKNKELLKEFFWFFMIFGVVAFFVAYLFVRPTLRMQERIEKLNSTLKEEKTQMELLLSVFDEQNSVLFKWRNDPNWSVSYVSKGVEKLLGYTVEDLIQHKVQYSDRVHPEDIKRVANEVQEALKENKLVFTHKPYRLIVKDNTVKWVLDTSAVVKNDAGEVTHFIGNVSDISLIKEQEQQLHNLARTDQLTKVYNRLYLDEILEAQYRRFQRNAEACSLIMIDIDYFKRINDKFGHLSGDTVLKELSSLMQGSVRASDVFGRWGGEEFLIILPHTKLTSATVLANKLLELIHKHQFEIVPDLSVSMGVAELKSDESIQKWVSRVDSALYQAKANGRDQVQIAS